MTFTKFTGSDGQPVWIVVESILAVRKDQSYTAVYAGQRDFFVKEEPTAVMDAIAKAVEKSMRDEAQINADAARSVPGTVK